MTRSAKWAVIRNEKPAMPWEDDDGLKDKSPFRRLAAAGGTALALKVWNDLQQLILNAPPPGDDEVVKEYRTDFTADLADRDGEEYAAMFWVLAHTLRLQAWGMRHELQAAES